MINTLGFNVHFSRDPKYSPKRGIKSLNSQLGPLIRVYQSSPYLTDPTNELDIFVTVKNNTEIHCVELLSWRKVVADTPIFLAASCHRSISNDPVTSMSIMFASTWDNTDTTKLVVDAKGSWSPILGSWLNMDL
jgi:hypothetical protein